MPAERPRTRRHPDRIQPRRQITNTLINGSKGTYGLVFQHTLDAIDQFNAVFGASLQDRAKDAGLSLPAPPEPVEARSLAP